MKDKDVEKMPKSILVVLLRPCIYCLWHSLQNTNAKACKRVICMEISVNFQNSGFFLFFLVF